MTSKSISLSFSSVLLIMYLFVSCSKSNDNPPNSIQEQIEDNISAGTWRITYFNDSGNDETNHFAGYNFTFGTNGVLTATNSTNTYAGTWSITDSNSNDDSKDDLDFNISFISPDNFADLTEDWSIVSQSSTEIELTHVSGGNGGTDFLTFQKTKDCCQPCISCFLLHCPNNPLDIFLQVCIGESLKKIH